MLLNSAPHAAKMSCFFKLLVAAFPPPRWPVDCACGVPASPCSRTSIRTLHRGRRTDGRGFGVEDSYRDARHEEREAGGCSVGVSPMGRRRPVTGMLLVVVRRCPSTVDLELRHTYILTGIHAVSAVSQINDNSNPPKMTAKEKKDTCSSNSSNSKYGGNALSDG